MIQKMMIEVETNKAISSYGDGHVLVYNSSKNNYYMQTREEFLKDINTKMDKILEGFKALEEKVRQSEKQSEIKYEDFLRTYQKTNSKMIDMIEKVVNSKEDYI